MYTFITYTIKSDQRSLGFHCKNFQSDTCKRKYIFKLNTFTLSKLIPILSFEYASFQLNFTVYNKIKNFDFVSVDFSIRLTFDICILLTQMFNEEGFHGTKWILLFCFIVLNVTFLQNSPHLQNFPFKRINRWYISVLRQHTSRIKP